MTDGTAPPPARGTLTGSPDAILTAAFRASRDALILFRAEDELIVDVNDAWCATTGLGRDEVIGKSQRSLDIWRGEDSLRFAEQMRAHGEVRDFRFSFRRQLPGGRDALGHASLSAQPITLDGVLFFLVAGRDLTAEVQAEQQRRQSHRLEELGRLAGGVAHDFNNLLTVIGAYASLAHEASADGMLPEPSDFQEILTATNKAAELTRRLLAFSRHQVVEPRPTDLNAVVAEEFRMLGRLIGEDVTLDLQLATELPLIMSDAVQIGQVLMNLAVNARDAMADGGRLTVRTALADCHPDMSLAGRQHLDHDRCVLLEVRDTGTGMNDETRERVFEPFFTTKPLGEGTGLGLAMVYGILRQAGGAIELDSAPGAGTTFRLFWPVAGAGGHAPRTAAPLAPRHGTGCVLVTEDDAAVRFAIVRMLRSAGYDVEESGNGAEALERVAADDGATLDLVLSDVVMPVMGGRELAERLAAIAPALPVVLMSGYSDREDLRVGLSNVATPVLVKPFDTATLLAAVASASGARAPA